jgi:hypothetical protein
VFLDSSRKLQIRQRAAMTKGQEGRIDHVPAELLDEGGYLLPLGLGLSFCPLSQLLKPLDVVVLV